jgi:hypothetical protein
MSQENVELIREGYARAGERVTGSLLWPMPPPTWSFTRGSVLAPVSHTEGTMACVLGSPNCGRTSSVSTCGLTTCARQETTAWWPSAGSATAAEVSGDWWFVYTFRRGDIIRIEGFAYGQQALEAAGLSE